MARAIRAARRGVLLVVLAGCATGDIDGGSTPVDPRDPNAFAIPPLSCATTCPFDGCAEKDHPYACPATQPWTSIPHAPACSSWDETYPAVVAGQCTASLPTGDAAKYAGPD